MRTITFFILLLISCTGIKNDREEYIRITSDEDSIKDMKVIYVSRNDTARIIVKSYWDNGQLQGLNYFVGGSKEGEWLGYYDDGKLSYKIRFLKDKKDGEHRFYNMEGFLHRVEYYKDGDSTGTWRFSLDQKLRD